MYGTTKDPKQPGGGGAGRETKSYHVPWFQIIRQSFRNQHSTVTAQKQTHVSTEKSPEINPILCGQLTSNKESRIYSGKGQSLQQIMLGKLNSYNTK